MANSKFSQGLRDAMLNGTSSIETVFNSGALELRDGTQPISANDVPTGQLLAVIDVPASAFAAVANGVLTKDAGVWEELSALITGTVTWFRLQTSGDGGALSTTDIRIDGDVTTATAGTGDLQMSTTAIVLADTVTVDSFTITVPE